MARLSAGASARATGQFDVPEGIAVDGSGTVFVADSAQVSGGNARIQAPSEAGVRGKAATSPSQPRRDYGLNVKRSPTRFSETSHRRSAFSGSRAYDLTPSRASGASFTAAT